MLIGMYPMTVERTGGILCMGQLRITLGRETGRIILIEKHGIIQIALLTCNGCQLLQHISESKSMGSTAIVFCACCKRMGYMDGPMSHHIIGTPSHCIQYPLFAGTFIITQK